MKFVALISGGKDSIFSIMEAQKFGHELICCAHLSPPCEEADSFLYQSVGTNVVPIISEECLGVPLVSRRVLGKSVNTDLTYTASGSSSSCNASDNNDNTDEVEDLYELLKSVIDQYPEVESVCNGAILSTYQRIRVEHIVCNRLGLRSLSYLWRMSKQEDILKNMIDKENYDEMLHAIIIKTAAPGLLPIKHLGKSLQELYLYTNTFQNAHSKFGFHMCGEGGEYETLVLDAPIFRKRIVLDETEIFYPDLENKEHARDATIFDGLVGILRIKSFHTEDKEGEKKEKNQNHESCTTEEKATLETTSTQKKIVASSTTTTTTTNDMSVNPIDGVMPHTPLFLPQVKYIPGGLIHISELRSPYSSSSSNTNMKIESAIQETKQIFHILSKLLKYHNLTPKDVIYVHFYLSDISLFTHLNKYYQKFFGSILPPSRSCVALPFEKQEEKSSCNVMLDLCALHNSGNYMRKQTSSAADDNNINCEHNKLRHVLHVQGISHWAPVCIGPYSQANIIRGSLIFMAGQIGLDPPTMTLKKNKKMNDSNSHNDDIKNQIESQLIQCWTNAASVLDSLDSGSLKDCLGALVYISSSSSSLLSDSDNYYQFQTKIHSICEECIKTNGGLIPGFIDEVKLEEEGEEEEKFGGYEDEETYLEMMKISKQKMEGEDSQHSKEEEKLLLRNTIPILIVHIPQLPMGALAEVELICGTRKLISSVGIDTRPISSSFPDDTTTLLLHSDENYLNLNNNNVGGVLSWDCGYNSSKNNNDELVDSSSSSSSQEELSEYRIDGYIRYMSGCNAMVWLTSAIPSSNLSNQSIIDFPKMIYNLVKEIRNASTHHSSLISRHSNSKQQNQQEISSVREVNLHPQYILHMRIYYSITTFSSNSLVDILKTTFYSSLVRCLSPYLFASPEEGKMNISNGNDGDKLSHFKLPVCTFVPVDTIQSLAQHTEEHNQKNDVILAAQVVITDLIHGETEMWCHYNREK